MHADLDNCSVSDFILNNHLNLDATTNLLGTHLDRDRLVKFHTNDVSNSKLWVWKSAATLNRISSVVYKHLNSGKDTDFAWKCWKLLRQLRVAPKIKVFHNQLPTFSYLYRINVGPYRKCVFW